jgi:hypothetical protein
MKINVKQINKILKKLLKKQIKTFIYNKNITNKRCEVNFISYDEHQSTIL